MSIHELIHRLRADAVSIEPEGQYLRCRAPAGVLTEDLVRSIRKAKPALLGLLQEEGESRPQVGRWARGDRTSTWPPGVDALIRCFLAATLPREPFRLDAARKVVDPALFFATLRCDIELGPSGPRARTGALAHDLDLLKEALGRADGDTSPE